MNNTKESWINPLQFALLTFSIIWGFHNTVNSYYYFDQTRSLSAWVLILAIYFVPTALMIAELGTSYRKCEGGVASWVEHTIGHKTAYLCGWIIWSTNLIYLSQKPLQCIVALNWLVLQTDDISHIDPAVVQLIGIAIFLCAAFFASRGVKAIKVIAVFAGTGLLTLCVLFIILGIFGPFFADSNNVSTFNINWDIQNFLPNNLEWISSISIIIFGLCGLDRSAPYILRMKNPSKEFPKGIILVTCMIVFCALFGIIALSTMFGQSGEMMHADFLTNGQYYAFQKLGQYFGVGNLFMIVYAICLMVACFSSLIINTDLANRIMVGNEDERFFPKFTLKKNKNGVYSFWIKTTVIIVVILQIIPCFGIEKTDILYKWLVDITAICLPIYNLFIFLSYMKLKLNNKNNDKNIFVFIKNKKIGVFVAVLCFVVTAFAICTKIYDPDPFIMTLNIVFPLLFLLTACIMPLITKYYNKTK